MNAVVSKSEDQIQYCKHISFILARCTDAAGSFDNDFMLVKLYGWSKDSILANISSNPSVPTREAEL